MIDVEDLIALVHNYNPRSNAELIRSAFAYGNKVHAGQLRYSGEPYFIHPVAVAAILTEQRLDDATIITALLHDTIEEPLILTSKSCLALKLLNWSMASPSLPTFSCLPPKASRPKTSASFSWRCPKTCG
jgi:hypothetical protein